MLTSQFERVFDRLGAAYIKMNAAFLSEVSFNRFNKLVCQPDLLFVQVLACKLRELVDLLLECVIDSSVGVAKVYSRIPHLQVKIGLPSHVVKVAAFACFKELRSVRIMYRVPMGTNFRFKREKFCFFGSNQLIGGRSLVMHC